MKEITEEGAQKFLDSHKNNMSVNGFWSDQSKKTIMLQIENDFRKDIIKFWYISDIVINGDRTLIKWEKRLIPLTDEKLKELYGS